MDSNWTGCGYEYEWNMPEMHMMESIDIKNRSVVMAYGVSTMLLFSDCITV